MARNLILGTLLSGLIAGTAVATIATHESPQEPVPQTKKVDGEKKSTTKKDEKAEKVTVWIMDASGKG